MFHISAKATDPLYKFYKNHKKWVCIFNSNNFQNLKLAYEIINDLTINVREKPRHVIFAFVLSFSYKTCNIFKYYLVENILLLIESV